VRTENGSISLLSPEVLRALLLKTIDVVEARTDLDLEGCRLERWSSASHIRSLDVVITWSRPDKRRFGKHRCASEEDEEPRGLRACAQVGSMLLGYYRCLVDKAEDALPFDFEVLDPQAMYDFLERAVFPATRRDVPCEDGQQDAVFERLREVILAMDKVPLVAPTWMLDYGVDSVAQDMKCEILSCL